MASIKNLKVNGTTYSINAVNADSASAVAWSNVTGKPSTYTPASHTHNTIVGVYTGSGGAQLPSYIGANTTRFNMMNCFKNSSGTSIQSFASYADVMMMNNYSWSDVPYATAFAIQKTTATPKAWIAAGSQDGWTAATELITANNVGSQSVSYATTAGSANSVTWSNVSSKPSYYDAKAIKSISRSGTTFTYTCMDDTTGTFTQQDNNTTYSIANASTAGLVKPVSVIAKPTLQSTTTTSGRYYSVQMSSDGNMFVNVPWTDNNTTYSFTNAAPTLAWNTTSTIGTVGGVALTVKMPANPNTDTHYTTKLVAGASSGTANSSTTSPYINVLDNTTYRSGVRLVGGGATSVSSDASGNITITSTNTTYSTRPNPYALTVQANGTTLATYTGSATATVNLTYSNVGAAAASHTHSYLPLSGGTITGGTTLSAGVALQLNTLKLPSTSGGTSYTAGSSGSVLKSNGTTVYWAADNNTNTDTKVSSATTTSKYYLVGSTSSSTATGTLVKRTTVYVDTSGNICANNISASGATLTWSSF